MMKFDTHFHTNVSDGYYSNEQVLAEAKAKGLDLAIVTEHDIVNTDFVNLAKQNNIYSFEGVEFSVYDDRIAHKSMHIVGYSTSFSKNVCDILDDTRKGRINKVKKQIEKLVSNGYIIDYEEFIEYYRNKGFDVNNLNNSQVSEYLMMNPQNNELTVELTGEVLSQGDFIRRCLKSHGDLKYIGWAQIERYEPSVRTIGELSKQEGFVVSLAHPNFTFRDDYVLFMYFVSEYKDLINGIEINSLASKEWVELILKTAKKYNLILTFGSDDHFVRDKVDDVHGQLGEMNPFVTEADMMENFKNFLMLVRATNGMKEK
ncbi:MAG: PHP domain-containing protein [Candidatus Gracilibacteria bacterium]|nr:PHP domain-containing protein [Candidatus Gracilibacteria bacterium]